MVSMELSKLLLKRLLQCLLKCLHLRQRFSSQQSHL